MIRPVDIALKYEGIREVGGANRGPEVERFLRTVKKPPGLAWCAAFVCTCVLEAYQRNYNDAGNVGPIPEKTLPIPLTAGVMALWALAPVNRRTGPRPGAIFIIDKGLGSSGARIGHTGFVVSVEGQHILTIEGNTSMAGSRDGDGVYRGKRRLGTILGFLDVSPMEKGSIANS